MILYTYSCPTAQGIISVSDQLVPIFSAYFVLRALSLNDNEYYSLFGNEFKLN